MIKSLCLLIVVFCCTTLMSVADDSNSQNFVSIEAVIAKSKTINPDLDREIYKHQLVWFVETIIVQ